MKRIAKIEVTSCLNCPFYTHLRGFSPDKDSDLEIGAHYSCDKDVFSEGYKPKDEVHPDCVLEIDSEYKKGLIIIQEETP